MRKCVLGAGALLALAGAAWGQAVRVRTDATGLHYEYPGRAPLGVPGSSPEALLWSHPRALSIPESAALSPGGQSAWVGQALNLEQLQRFQITGAGNPTFETEGGTHPFPDESPMIVAASQETDFAVLLDWPAAPEPGTKFLLRAYNSAGTPLWSRAFSDVYDGVGRANVQVSRDGSTVAVGLNQGNTSSLLYFLNASDGSIAGSWSGETGTIGSVDLTDDGSLALVLHASPNATARLVSRATGLETFSAGGSGVGSQYKVSGDGTVVALGGFSFNVWKNTAGSWSQVISFTAPTSWFGSGLAVSRDGSTAATVSHNYLGYLINEVRTFDVASGTLLGTHTTAGSGAWQSSVMAAALSDDGSRLVAGVWGTEIEGPPEVMAFDRTATLIDSLDTPGSPFALDMSGDGRYVLVGTKAAHANTIGNGGTTYLLDLGGGGGGCYANCDSSTQTPVLNVTDFTCFLQRYAAGESYANCDNSTQAPQLNVQDFTCFLQMFAGGCP